MEKTYYTINEEGAKLAKSLMSFDDYVEGSKTSEYRSYVDAAYEKADEIAEAKPDRADKAYGLADRYAKKMAEYMNNDIRIGTMCPSVFITGAGNFPVKKKERQIKAWDNNRKVYDEAESILEKIDSLRYSKEQIKSGDENAIEQLEEKLSQLKDTHETMKRINAYYRKNKSLAGCPDLTGEAAEKIPDEMKKYYIDEGNPFPGFELTNSNQNIKRIEGRIKRLKAAKEEGTKSYESDFCKVVENTEIMCLQLIFDGKPSDSFRTILKKNGFRWAPSQSAWQRHLNINGKCALKRVLEEFKSL